MALKTLTGYALVLLRKDDSILLVQRSHKASFAPGYYSIIGGSLEANETFRQAAVREVAEEVGVTIHENSLSFAHTFYRSGALSELVAYIFECSHWEGKLENKEPEKHEQVLWAPQAKLPTPMLPAHSSALQLIGNSIFYSEQKEGL